MELQSIRDPAPSLLLPCQLWVMVSSSYFKKAAGAPAIPFLPSVMQEGRREKVRYAFSLKTFPGNNTSFSFAFVGRLHGMYHGEPCSLLGSFAGDKREKKGSWAVSTSQARNHTPSCTCAHLPPALFRHQALRFSLCNLSNTSLPATSHRPGEVASLASNPTPRYDLLP